MLTISKDKSTQIKGVVILMMVWLHLFNGSHTDLCDNLLYIDGVPLAKWMSCACGPVSFFLLLSGYGLAYTFDKGRLTMKGQLRRLLRLYVHYWMVLSIFLTIGCFVASERYPGTWVRILLDASGWEYKYNGEMWFLFPYCMVSISSPLIINVIKRLGLVVSVLLSGVIYLLTCFCFSRYGVYLYGNMFLYRPILFLQFLFPFSLGVVFYLSKVDLNVKLRSRTILFCIVILMSVVASLRGSAVIYMAYVPLMTWLLCQLSCPRWLSNILLELGRKSMVIWMVHTWFCYYLFQPQIYSLRYPILIMVEVVVISYLTAIPVMWTTNKLLSILKL